MADGRMSIIDHLAELRRRIIVCAVAVVLAGIVVFVLWQPISDFLIAPYRDLTRTEENPDGQGLIFTGPLEAFNVRLKVATYGGIALALPVIMWQIWRFVAPGLYGRERRYAVPFLTASIALFLLGAGLAWLVVPQALDFLLNVGGDNLDALISAEEYLSLVTLMVLAFGVAFEFPLLLVALLLVRAISTATLRRFRRHTIIGLAVFTAIITPSQDPYSMLILLVPLYLFYEIVILIGRVMHR